MPEEKPTEEQVTETPEPAATEEKPKGDETKAELESQVAGMRAEIDRIRESNRNLKAEVEQFSRPAPTEPAPEVDELAQLGELPADEAVRLLAQEVQVLKAARAEDLEEKRSMALQQQIGKLQEVRKGYGFEPMPRDEIAELLQFTENRGYSRLHVAWKERDEEAIREKLIQQGAVEKKGQDELTAQTKGEAAAPSLSAAGQAENEEGARLYSAARGRGYVPPIPSA